jgi:hypothetical protein
VLDSGEVVYDDVDTRSPVVVVGSERNYGPRGSLWARWCGRRSTDKVGQWLMAHGGGNHRRSGSCSCAVVRRSDNDKVANPRGMTADR